MKTLRDKLKETKEKDPPGGKRFSEDEDIKIFCCFLHYDNEWEEMKIHFTNRTGLMIKNRYYALLRNRKWTDLQTRSEDPEDKMF